MIKTENVCKEEKDTKREIENDEREQRLIGDLFNVKK